jgi:hypothetical protein
LEEFHGEDFGLAVVSQAKRRVLIWAELKEKQFQEKRTSTAFLNASNAGLDFKNK